eukprot:tig00000989_g6122.t1
MDQSRRGKVPGLGSTRATEEIELDISPLTQGADGSALAAGEWFAGSGGAGGKYTLRAWLLAADGAVLEERSASAEVDGGAPARLAHVVFQTPPARAARLRLQHGSEPREASGWGPVAGGAFLSVHPTASAARSAAAALRRQAARAARGAPARRRWLAASNGTTPTPSPPPERQHPDAVALALALALPGALADAHAAPPLWAPVAGKSQDARIELETVGPGRSVNSTDTAAAGLADALRIPRAGAEVPEAVRLFSATHLRLRAHDLAEPAGQAVLGGQKLREWVPTLMATPANNRFFLGFRVLSAALIGPSDLLLPAGNLTAAAGTDAGGGASSSGGGGSGISVPALVGAVIGSCLGTASLAVCFYSVQHMRAKRRVYVSRQAHFASLEKQHA